MDRNESFKSYHSYAPKFTWEHVYNEKYINRQKFSKDRDMWNGYFTEELIISQTEDLTMKTMK